MTNSNTLPSTAKWTKRKLFLFAIFTLFILFILLEIIFRVSFYFKHKRYYTTVAIQGSPLQLSDNTLVFLNQPFYLDYNNRYQYNEEGMKSAPRDVFIPAKTANDYWVLLTGASAMEGMGSNRNGEWLDITGIEDHPYDKTIAYYLQQMLQQQMPDKKVKVFNAAFSSSCINQSYWRYLQLASRLQPDWVISMDGQNDPSSLQAGETTTDYIKAEWKKNPQFHYPLKLIIPLTSHSAFINAMKQKLFDIKQKRRLHTAEQDGYPARKKWSAAIASPLTMAVLNDDIKRAVDNFSSWISKYDSMLTARDQKHLLLLQPHMFFRDTTALTITEKAVNHYYRAQMQDAKQHCFLNELYRKFSKPDSLHRNIMTMQSVHRWKEWVFVDYCHFTEEATKKIAFEIYTYILSGGKAVIFKSK